MVAFPNVDSITSALSLILAAIASLRAASRLERRIDGGSIGLMDGPPIPGPPPAAPTGRRRRRDGPPPTVTMRHGSRLLEDDGGGTIERDEDGETGDGGIAVGASPLWEHAEAFRRAAILGLIFDNNYDDDEDYSDIFAAFSDVVRREGRSGHVGGGVGSGEDLAIAAAVEAGLGLLMPEGSTRGGGSAARHRVRGGGGGGGARSGGGALKSSGRMRGEAVDDSGCGGSGNPISLVASWFVRELSAPFAAIPAWHGLLCSYLRERKDTELRKSRQFPSTPWERSLPLLTWGCRRRAYDPSGLDFDSSISATAQIPRGSGASCVDDPTASIKSVRVRAFAPGAFRDLRNKCFRVKEREYAESILNAMNVAITPGIFLQNGEGIFSNDEICEEELSPDEDSTMYRVIQGILSEGEQKREVIRQKVQTLPYVSFQSNSKGAARAGTFFFFTADGAYMIKTVKSEEARAFLDMLPEYHRFMSQGVNGQNSLLTRIFGMYSVQFPSDADVQPAEDMGDRWDGGLFSSSHERASSLTDDERVYLVMHSVFPPEASSFVTERFDLKGSTVGRECSLEERRLRGANAVLKDLDLKREVEEELIGANLDAAGSGHDRKKETSYGICVGKRNKAALMTQLERDIDLLCRCNVLDFSLLIGVADMEISNRVVKEKASSRRVPAYIHNFFRWMDFPMPYYGAGTTKVNGGALSSLQGTRKGKHVMYYLGVIDFLQPWTVKKRMERDFKGLIGYDKSGISCVAPADYATRFLKFVNSHVT